MSTSSKVPALELQRPRLDRLRARSRAVAPVSADVWALAGLIVLAAAIRIITIDNQSFWMDESLTVYEARLPFGAMVNTVAHIETTPPLFFVLIWGWAKVFGTSEVALRSISTIAGIALVPIAYLAARELFSRWAGVVAAALVALNPFLIWYSQEARAYMLLAALTGAGFLWFVRAIGQPSRRNLGWWAGCSGLALMTHFFAGFIVAPEALWLLWRHRQRLVLAALAAVGLVQLAMLPFAIVDSGHGTGWIAQVPRLHRITVASLEWGVSLLSRRGTTIEGLAGWALVLGLAAGLVVIAGDRRTRAGFTLAGSVAAFVILVPIVLGRLGLDYFLARNMIPAFVPLAAAIGGACVVSQRRTLGGLLAAALLVMFVGANFVVQTDGALQRPAWRDVARALGPAPVRRAVIVVGGTSADPLKIYLPGVNWVQPQSRQTVIGEVDIVGARKKVVLAPPPVPRTGSGPSLSTRRTRKASPLPVNTAPTGTRLVARFQVRSWVVARFVLDRPWRLNIKRLLMITPRFFRHTPSSLLVFLQEPRR